MPDPEPVAAAPPRGNPPSTTASPRTPAERAADHRAVERLAGDLLPALIGRLAASGLAELEVREGPWKVRLRRPLELVGGGRRVGDRQLRLPAPGAAAVGQPGGAHATRPAAPGPGGSAEARAARADARPERRSDPPLVTAPAVGIFRPRGGLRGTEVRAGDRLGVVDMLGIAQDVLAPADGVVGEILAEPGDGVEYGQPLFAMAAPRGVAAGEAIPIEAEDQLAAPAGERG